MFQTYLIDPNKVFLFLLISSQLRFTFLLKKEAREPQKISHVELERKIQERRNDRKRFSIEFAKILQKMNESLLRLKHLRVLLFHRRKYLDRFICKNIWTGKRRNCLNRLTPQKEEILQRNRVQDWKLAFWVQECRSAVNGHNNRVQNPNNSLYQVITNTFQLTTI